MAQASYTRLPKLETRLAAVIGPDLAHSLVIAASARGDAGTNIRLLLNDRLPEISEDQRKDVLQVLDIYQDTFRRTRH